MLFFSYHVDILSYLAFEDKRKVGALELARQAFL